MFILPRWQHPLLDAVFLSGTSFYLMASIVPFLECYPFRIPPRLIALVQDCGWLYERLERHFVLGRYVKFASVTTSRTELVIEATDRGGKRHEWPFKFKPTSIDARPPPTVWLMPGVDWQCWFVGLRPFEQPDWLSALLRLALSGDRDVCALLGPCPVAPSSELVALRLALYDYRYAGCEPADDARFERGAVWSRRFLGYLGASVRRSALGGSSDDELEDERDEQDEQDYDDDDDDTSE